MDLEAMLMAPSPVGTSYLLVDEAIRRIPFRNTLSQEIGKPRRLSRYLIRAPGCISSGAGVSTLNLSHGGVIFSRLRASAKNGKTCSTGLGSTWIDVNI